MHKHYAQRKTEKETPFLFCHPCIFLDEMCIWKLTIDRSVQLQLVVYSRCYNERPLVIQGAGAGNDTTAAGVLADILDLQDLF